MQYTILLLIIGYLSSAESNVQKKCIPRKFNHDSYVCVCNSTYCDSLEFSTPEKGQFVSYVSSRDGGRLDENLGAFDSSETGDVKLRLDIGKKYQTILGFGGSFTDAAGLNIQNLSKATQDQLMRTYFGPEGSRYSLARTHVGGVDFSPRAYSLDDVPGDVTLQNFSLTFEDYNYKIPYMKQGLELNPDLIFLSAAWTAPPWMKTNNAFVGYFGRLRDEYYQLYADYLVKYLETYKDHGLPIWAISTGNEPENGIIPDEIINDMAWSPSAVAKWVVENFGPAIAASKSNETMILAPDGQRALLPWFIDEMFETDEKVDKYVKGIANHLYTDSVIPTSILDTTHRKYPDKYLIMTEACIETAKFHDELIALGSWTRGESYMHSLIEYLNHWWNGWIDWNLALDGAGGPNWVGNYVDAPVIVNPETDEFFKQPMFYAITHVSKFIPRGSVRVDLSSDEKIESVAVVTPNKEIVIVLFNRNDADHSVTIIDPEKGNINVPMTGHSFRTIVYKQ